MLALLDDCLQVDRLNVLELHEQVRERLLLLLCVLAAHLRLEKLRQLLACQLDDLLWLLEHVGGPLGKRIIDRRRPIIVLVQLLLHHELLPIYLSDGDRFGALSSPLELLSFLNQVAPASVTEVLDRGEDGGVRRA